MSDAGLAKMFLNLKINITIRNSLNPKSVQLEAHAGQLVENKKKKTLEIKKKKNLEIKN